MALKEISVLKENGMECRFYEDVNVWEIINIKNKLRIKPQLIFL